MLSKTTSEVLTKNRDVMKRRRKYRYLEKLKNSVVTMIALSECSPITVHQLRLLTIPHHLSNLHLQHLYYPEG